MEISGAVVIVTGASSGIGRATAAALLGLGAQVVLAARREDRLRAVVDALGNRAAPALIQPTDVASPPDVERLIEATLARFGRIDVLINNAGVGELATIEDTSLEDMRALMEVNFMGTFYLTKLAVPVMRRQGRGHIINVSSIAGHRGLPLYSAYCATKFAQVGLTEALRVELAGTGVQVSVVCPVGTRTEFFSALKNRRKNPARPLGYTQSAETVANAIVGCIRRPRAEVLPFPPARMLLLLNALFPSLVDRALRRAANR